MFSFIKFKLMQCPDYLNVANGRKSLFELFADTSTTFHSEVFAATISTAEITNPDRPFLNSSLF